MRVRMCGESLPVEVGRGGGPQAESLEPRFLPPEPPNKSQVPALPFLQPCCWTGTLSFPSSNIYWLNAPPHNLEQLPGEVATIIEAFQVSDEIPTGHALPNVLREENREM